MFNVRLGKSESMINIGRRPKAGSAGYIRPDASKSEIDRIKRARQQNVLPRLVDNVLVDPKTKIGTVRGWSRPRHVGGGVVVPIRAKTSQAAFYESVEV